MTDIDMELREVTVNGEVVYVNRFGDLWRWKRHNHGSPKFRKIVSKLNADGYLCPRIGRTRVRVHRIVASAFLNLDVTDLKIQVDHINGVKHDNRLDNLRLVTCQQNHFNHTKAKGYCWSKRDKKWQANIHLDNRTIFLGYFDNPEDARQAYLDAKPVYHKIP